MTENIPAEPLQVYKKKLFNFKLNLKFKPNFDKLYSKSRRFFQAIFILSFILVFSLFLMKSSKKPEVLLSKLVNNKMGLVTESSQSAQSKFSELANNNKANDSKNVENVAGKTSNCNNLVLNPDALTSAEFIKVDVLQKVVKVKNAIDKKIYFLEMDQNQKIYFINEDCRQVELKDLTGLKLNSKISFFKSNGAAKNMNISFDGELVSQALVRFGEGNTLYVY